jgi:Type-IV b secretion system, inner-membrane complex component
MRGALAVLALLLLAAPAPDWMAYPAPQASANDTAARPNVTTGEVLDIASSALPTVLSFYPGVEFRIQAKVMQSYFEPSGWAGYAAFLRESHIVEAASTTRYQVVTIFEQPPVIVASGPEAGMWRWVIVAPVMISVIEPATEPGGEGRTLWTRKADLRVAISRTSAGKISRLAITAWDGTMRATP